ncbi:MAG: pyridoxine 5'-phosphate synthase [Planctomycetes bacterium]|nr:pyridoxine 5'-phosphate synthase [Planctomycetota bacterium]
MALLGVNVDHVATVREARKTYEPDPVWAAAEATIGGADIITIHLRKDRRHIQDRDLRLLRQTSATDLNLEMSLADEIVEIALSSRPDMVTLVPENRREVTTEGGLDVLAQSKRVEAAIKRFAELGIPVSLFTDPVEQQLQRSADLGATFVELHTGAYANAKAGRPKEDTLTALEESAAYGRRLGLVVNAGHGLTYQNVTDVVKRLRPHELHIGHSIVSRAIFVGIREAVRQMKEIIHRAQADGRGRQQEKQP